MGRSPNLDFERAFDALYAIAHQTARRVVGPDDAADVAAEVMSSLLVRWSRLSEVDYLPAWVARCAVNESLDVYRKRRRSFPHTAGPVESVSTDEADAVATRVALCEALTRLPRRQREVVSLRYLADLSQQQTAQLLGLSVGSVAQHTNRALQELRQRIGDSMMFEPEAQS